MEKLVDIGKQMGLEGESLQKFVFEQQAIERDERVAKREHEKLLKEAELKIGQRSKLGFYVPFNSQGHIGTGPQNCHLWDSNPQR